MLLRFAGVLVIVPLTAIAQSTCPPVNFLAPRTVNLKPSSTSHIDVVRQSDGSYTGFEVTDAPPFRTLRTTPHFEKQFAVCLPHTIPGSPRTTLPNANPSGAGSQLQVSASFASGNTFVAKIGSDNLTVYFDIFDSGHNLLSQTSFTLPLVNPPFNQNQILYSLALADINRDGNLDLIAVFESPVAGSYWSDGVWVFAGNGDGTFQAGHRQVLNASAHLRPAFSVAIGDLNGDGKLDIVFGAVNEAPFIALGNGDGTFNPQTLQLAAPITFFLGLGSAAIADLNGDGKADLVFFAPVGGEVAVTLGNGDGTFQAISLYPVLSTYATLSTASVAVGDVNGDGIPDIVTASGSILFGDGKGGFPSRKDYASSASGSVMLADFDGDGLTDIIIGNGNPDFLSGTAPYFYLSPGGATDSSLTVLFGAGGGAFTGAPVSDVGGGESLAAADFDGDGIPDLAVMSRGSNLVSILKGKGNGEFASVSTQNFASGTFLVSVVAADFNHDGKPDLAVLLALASGEGSEVQIFPGHGDGTFGTPFTLPVSAAPVNFIAAPDVNGDGIPDLVVTSTSSLIVWLGKGDGTLTAPVFEQDGNAPAVAFGDFNGDGKLDIAVTNPLATTVTVLLGHGDGTFPNSVSSTLPGPANGGPNSLVAADFTGDGKLDLAVTLSGDAQIAVLTGQGNGQFPAYHLSPVGALTIFAVDVNGDKLTDLIAISPSARTVAGNASALIGNGDGTFQPSAAIMSLPLNVSAAIADFNRDGKPDVALVASEFGVAAFLNLSQPPPPLTVVSAASFAAGSLAPNSIAAAFGEGILPSADGIVASSNPPPTSLSGITVTVLDSAGASRPAPLFFASDIQINFLVPAATATGPATVTVNTMSGKQLSAQAQIAAVAPALFTVGSGIAAAYALQIAPGGAQSIVSVFTVQSGTIVPTPIDLTQPGQVFLVLFGTGFDAATAGSTVAAVQGVSAPVTYSGPQASYAGLDQVNLLLPQSLAGTGVASVSVSMGAKTSNTVFVTIR